MNLQSRTLTHFFAFEEHMADKCLAKPSQTLSLFFVPTHNSLFNTSDSYLKSVRP